MSAQARQTVESLQLRIAALEKINRALMDRVERSVDSAGNAYSVFESNILMQRVIAERTEQLERSNAALTAEIQVRRAAEEKLRLARDLAEAASKAKTDFLANMSHEIRTPMTAILGYADLALDDHEDPARRKEHLEVIKRNGHHLLTIINDILDLSKLEAGEMQVAREPVDLRAITAGVVEILRVHADQKGLELSAVVEATVPPTVETDAVRFRQMLLNLLGNAVKFTEQGSVSVRTRYSSSDSTLTVEISDTGIGIPAAAIDRVFQPFHQADSSVVRRHGGTGLGLSIVKRFAVLLGGDVTVTSQPGSGSTFTLTIIAPAVADRSREASDDQRPASVVGRIERRCGPPLSGIRILLAEDGPDNQRLISFLLRKAGATVTIAEDGQLALDHVHRDASAFDLILMDMQMPRMDGYSAASILKSEACPTPIVALTAHAMAGDREKCLAAGCDGYLTKPVDRARLIETCRRMCGLPARRAA
jgi:signal transduction histidine kinase